MTNNELQSMIDSLSTEELLDYLLDQLTYLKINHRGMKLSDFNKKKEEILLYLKLHKNVNS